MCERKCREGEQRAEKNREGGEEREERKTLALPLESLFLPSSLAYLSGQVGIVWGAGPAGRPQGVLSVADPLTCGLFSDLDPRCRRPRVGSYKDGLCRKRPAHLTLFYSGA